MSRPIWFLDIDGVINALESDHDDRFVSTTAWTQDIEWPIRYRPSVVDFINEVHRAGLVEIRWLTTWEHDAGKSLAPAVGLDDFNAYLMTDNALWWKADIVAQSMRKEGRPIIWTDDEIDSMGVSHWFDAAPVSALLASTNPDLGLADDELAGLATFLGLASADA